MKERIRRISVYGVLLWKRMWKTHKFFLAFLVLPFLLVAMMQLIKGEATAIQVAVYIEGLEKGDVDAGSSCFLEELQKRLEAKEDAVRFYIYDSEEAVKEEVASARAECGYCIPADLQQKLEKGKYTKIIKSYESPQSSLQTVCEEALFAEIFSLYEETTFGEQAAGLICEELEENQKQTIKEEERLEIANRAEELLEKYRYNGSTFQFAYETYAENAEQKIEEKSFISVKGILALAIYICGLCGTLDTLEDEKKGIIVRLKSRKTFQVLTIYMPIFMMSFVTVICLVITGQMQDVAKELLGMIIYQIIMIIYCLLLKKLCRKEESLVAAMPVLILASVIVCPVFIDLSQFIPVFRVLEKVFPMSYYLRM